MSDNEDEEESESLSDSDDSDSESNELSDSVLEYLLLFLFLLPLEDFLLFPFFLTSSSPQLTIFTRNAGFPSSEPARSIFFNVPRPLTSFPKTTCDLSN